MRCAIISGIKRFDRKTKQRNTTMSADANKKNGEKSKNRTFLNPAYRIDAGVNSRKFKSGYPIALTETYDKETGDVYVRYLDQETADGGCITPFNILCRSIGACAIKQVIFDGDDTIVLFADGDKVVIHRSENDRDDQVTAILWALAKKVFGKDVVKQINRVIKYRSATRAQLRKKKEDAKWIGKPAKEAAKLVEANKEEIDSSRYFDDRPFV